MSHYAPIKAAIDNLFKCLQFEYKDKIKFKSIYLSAVDTQGYRYTNGYKNINKTIKTKEAILKITKNYQLTKNNKATNIRYGNFKIRIYYNLSKKRIMKKEKSLLKLII